MASTSSSDFERLFPLNENTLKPLLQRLFWAHLDKKLSYLIKHNSFKHGRGNAVTGTLILAVLPGGRTGLVDAEVATPMPDDIPPEEYANALERLVRNCGLLSKDDAVRLLADSIHLEYAKLMECVTLGIGFELVVSQRRVTIDAEGIFSAKTL